MGEMKRMALKGKRFLVLFIFVSVALVLFSSGHLGKQEGHLVPPTHPQINDSEPLPNQVRREGKRDVLKHLGESLLMRKVKEEMEAQPREPGAPSQEGENREPRIFTVIITVPEPPRPTPPIPTGPLPPAIPLPGSFSTVNYTTSLPSYQTCLNRKKTCNFLLYKTHKTASTTLASILFRFGIRHRRKFMIGEDHYVIPLLDRFNETGHEMMIQHHRTNYLSFESVYLYYAQLMTHHQLVSVVRDPKRRYVSAFHYYFEPLSANHNFTHFLVNRDYVDQQARDFGVHDKHQLDLFLGPQGLASSFNVLITEKFDESLILLKRKFNWDLKDILYLRLLQGCHKDAPGEQIERLACKDPPELADPEIQEKIEQNNVLDQAIYNHFLTIHEERIKQQDASFWEELKDFQSKNKALNDHCQRDLELHFRNATAYFLEQRASDCYDYVIDDLQFNSIIRKGKGRVNEFQLFDF